MVAMSCKVLKFEAWVGLLADALEADVIESVN